NYPKCGNPDDGQYCQGCALLRKKFKEDLFTYCIEKGILQYASEPSYDNTNIVNAPQEPFVVKQDPGENSSQSPPQINHHCCYECSDSLEDIFFHKCTCELCGKGAHYGYNYPSEVLIIPDPKPFNNQTVDELPQTLPCFDPTCYSEDGNSFTYDSTSNLVHDSPNDFNPPSQPPLYSCEFYRNDAQLDEFIKSSVENLVPIPSQSEGNPSNMCDVPFHDNSPPLNVSKDQFEDFFDSNDDSTSIDDDSFSIDNIEYVEASPPDSELVSSEVMEIVIPEVGGIDDDILLQSKTISFRLVVAVPLLVLIFLFQIMKLSMTIMLKRLVVVVHTHSDSSLYDSFIFDLLINPFPPADMSDFYHEEFADEFAHIISPPEYDCFCFKNEPNARDFTMDVVEDIFPTREPRVHNALPTHPTLQLNLDFILSSKSLFAHVVWIFLPSLSYSVAPQYLLSFRNEDTIFDPDICSYHISSFMPDVSHRSGTFNKFNVLNGRSMEILFPLAPPWINEFGVESGSRLG
nr:hypothetical protein [Tanacetum cinerariifolium]